MTITQWLNERIAPLADEGNRLMVVALPGVAAIAAAGMLLTGWAPVAPLGRFLFGSVSLLAPPLVALALLTGGLGMCEARRFWRTPAPATLGMALLAIGGYGTPWRTDALAVPAVLFLLTLVIARMAHRPLGAPRTAPLLLGIAALGLVPVIGGLGPLVAGAAFLGIWAGGVTSRPAHADDRG